MTYDYSDFDDKTLGDNLLSVLSHAAQEQLDAEAEVERCEEALKTAKEKLKQISWYKLPKLMDEARQEKCVAAGGIEIAVKEDVRASIPAANEAKALTYLESVNQAGMIKRQFIIEFGREEESWAKKFERDLKQRKKPVNCKIKRSVPHQTLSAWVRKELEEGTALPLDLLGVFRQRISTVKVKVKEK